MYHFKVSLTLCLKVVVSNCWDCVLPYSCGIEKESVFVSEFLAKLLRFILAYLTLVTCPLLK